MVLFCIPETTFRHVSCQIISENMPMQTLIFCNYSNYPKSLFDTSNIECIFKKRLYVLPQDKYLRIESLVEKFSTSCRIGEKQCWYNLIIGEDSRKETVFNKSRIDITVFLEELQNVIKKFNDDRLKKNISLTINAMLSELKGL